jgi:hypothetical protein
VNAQSGLQGSVSGGLPGIAGDRHGRATRRLENSHCWIEFLATGGPRIVGFGLAGAPNLLAETPDVSWDSGHGNFELVGGHRLWFAPETPECSVPDSSGLELSGIEGGIRLIGAFQAPTGLRKSIDIRLDPDSAAVSLRHVIRNEGQKTLELAAWPITQLKPGGVASVELPKKAQTHVVTPNRCLVLWPYASWSDPRLTIDDGLLTVAALPDEPFKIGCLSHAGSVSYLLEGVLFVKSFDPSLGSPHADFGCNMEIYSDRGAIELESLGPLVQLKPGESAIHDERWDIRLQG